MLKILKLDIETTPNLGFFWNTRQRYINPDHIIEASDTLCWAAQWLGKKKVYFRTRNDKDCLTLIHDLLDEADAVIHFNGKRFDIPVLNKEFLLNDMPPPSPYHQIDLFQTVRKKFKFESNKLDYVCQRLGIGAKVQHKGMELWFGCMQNKKADWKVMKEYNIQDVLLLEELYNKLLPWIDNHPNHALYVDETERVCPNCGSTHVNQRGYRKTLTQIYPRYKCMDCESWSRGRSTVVPPERRQNILRSTS